MSFCPLLPPHTTTSSPSAAAMWSTFSSGVEMDERQEEPLGKRTSTLDEGEPEVSRPPRNKAASVN